MKLQEFDASRLREKTTRTFDQIGLSSFQLAIMMELLLRLSIEVTRRWVMIIGDKTSSAMKLCDSQSHTRDLSQIAFDIYCKETIQHIEWERQKMVRNGDDDCLLDFDDFPPLERDLAIEWMYLDPRSRAYYENMAETDSDTLFGANRDFEYHQHCENKILQAQLLWLEPAEKESVDFASWPVDRRLFMACLLTLFVMTFIAFMQIPSYRI
jgi:hypothetical protein